MGMTTKALKTMAAPFFAPNDPATRGLTGVVVPYRFSGLGMGVATALPMIGSIGATLLSASNRAAVGRVSYQPSMARMVGGTNTGAVEAMKRASKGDYGTFAEMASSVVNGSSLTSFIDDYGAGPAMISALYNMGR